MFKPLAMLAMGLFLSCTSFGQLKYIGLTGGLTLSNQKWRTTDPFLQCTDCPGERFKGKNRLGGNGSLYTEWGLHHMFSWVSELEYNRKGENERSVFIPNTRTHLVSWNNYAKFRLDWYDGSPYVLAGPRVEYQFGGTPLDFGPLVIGLSGGAGYEFYKWDPWVIFGELHYNPSVLPSYKSSVTRIYDRAWLLKIGIKFHWKSSRNFDDCPPVYTLNQI